MSSRQRDRLKNAVIFFAGNTHFCGLVKLFRLLYVLDVMHFQQTGQTVTGEHYAAYEFGPAPVYLYEHWDQIYSELYRNGALASVSDASIDFNERCYETTARLDPSHFTRRQHVLMVGLAEKYQNSQHKEVILGNDNNAWAKTWKHGAGKGKPIPFELTVNHDSRHGTMILERQKEEEMRMNTHRLLMRSGGHAA